MSMTRRRRRRRRRITTTSWDKLGRAGRNVNYICYCKTYKACKHGDYKSLDSGTRNIKVLFWNLGMYFESIPRPEYIQNIRMYFKLRCISNINARIHFLKILSVFQIGMKARMYF